MLKARGALIAVLSFALLTPAFVRSQVAGQQTPIKPPTGIIVGQLVDGTSGSPVSSATITLSLAAAPPAAPGGAPPPPPGRSGFPVRGMDVLTDGNGRFVFHSLPAGFYSLAANRPGYLRSQYGQVQAPSPLSPLPAAGRRIELTDGQRLTNVSMKIWKYASISI